MSVEAVMLSIVAGIMSVVATVVVLFAAVMKPVNISVITVLNDSVAHRI